jgi:hypothetical protein
MLAAFAVAVAALPAASLAGGGVGQDNPQQGYATNPKYARALAFCNAYKAEARLRSCLISGLLKLVVESHDPADELPRIDGYVASAGGYVLSHCHVLMHTVGREYGQATHVTLAKLRDYLPRTNNANCSAGFGHGLLTYLAPQLGVMTPKQAAAQCDGVGTRYQRYSCIHGFGHAYMRLYGELLPLALHSCRLLGPENAADCAAGAFHDYWIAVSSLDGTHKTAAMVTSPRELCAKNAGGFVRGCWYRALLEHPPKRSIHTAADIRAVCAGLNGIQRAGCVTAASVISSDDPFSQLELCAGFRNAEAVDCVRGVRAPDLGQGPMSQQVELIRGCASLVRIAQRGCYTWLGKALNVVANGRFGRHGCSELSYAATRARCKAGAATYEGPLETFS